MSANAEPPDEQTTTPYDMFAAAGTVITAPGAGGASPFVARNLADTQGTVPQVFATSFKAGTSPAQGGLTIEDVTGIINSAGAQADQTRAAIRLPIGTPARVNIAVVDASGAILGMFRTLDAPIFGFDVAAQKARTAAFFSHPAAGSDLQQAGFTDYVAAAAADGVALDGTVAFSTRAMGFLSQPIFPPGAIAPFANGPLSQALGTWSVFNTGLQLDMYLDAPGAISLRLRAPVLRCPVCRTESPSSRAVSLSTKAECSSVRSAFPEMELTRTI